MNILRSFLSFSSNEPLPTRGHSRQHLRLQRHIAGKSFVFLLVALACGTARAQTLTNGALYAGNITANATNSHTLTASAGDSVVVRVGQLTAAGFFNPWLRVYGPGGTLVGSGTAAGDLAEEIALTATNSGTFTVLVSDGNYGGSAGTGTYQLNYVTVPGDSVESAGDEGGLLTNGTLNEGTISSGDLDVWRFTANSADSVVVRVGQLTAAGFFNPWLRVYGPNGALVGSGNVTGDATEEIVLTATNGGTFTVVVSDGNYGGIGGTGTYQLNYATVPGNFVVSPGDEGGLMTNGLLNAGTTSAGDLDVWNLTANIGDSVVVRVGQLAAAAFFNPWLRVYGPNGALVGSGNVTGDAAQEVTLTATNSGTFTALVSDGNYGGYEGTGTYQISYVKIPGDIEASPGDEGGVLTNGTLNAGTNGVGDLDSWNFTANTGDNFILRMGALTAANFFVPWLRVYGPNGALIGSSLIAGETASEFAFTATNSGNFTVLFSDGNYGGYNGTGNYQLSYVKVPGSFVVSPGDEGGEMTNGVTYSGTNSLGDLDVWRFYGTAGDSNVFRIWTTNFTPWLRLYGPTGAMVAQAFSASANNRTNFLNYVVTNSGTYTLVSSPYYVTQSGTYNLKQSRVPPDLIVPDTQILNEGATLNVTISAQDPDVPFQPLNFTPIFLPAGATFSQTGSTNASITWPTTEASGPSTNVIVASVTDVVNGKAFTRTNSFTVVINEINEPPQLTMPGTQTIDELTPLNVSITGTDPDIPTNELTFSLISPPLGMTIDSASGAISWMPTEAQGPSTNIVTVVVTDDNPWAINEQHLSATNSFTVLVREINLAPLLTVPNTQTIDELTPLNVSASATDADLPPNGLTFSLLSPPQGMNVNPTSGAISWTPTEAQGPSTNTIIVVVTDDNPAAFNAQHLSTTNSFTVNVREVNTPPQVTVPGDQTINELTALSASVTASDSDLPANPLTFSLISPPTGMTINPTTGAVSWTPTEAEGPSTNIIKVVVTDTNSAAAANQQLSVTNTFTVVVNEVNAAPQLTVPGDQTIDELTPMNVSASTTDSDLPANPLTFSLISPPTGMMINPTTGAVSWTPTEAEGPSTNTITVLVADTNAAALGNRLLTATNKFTVVVRESNVAPQLAAITNQSLHFGLPLSVQVTASDSDLPANTLTFSLDQSPTNMNINATSGLVTWTPLESQVGPHPITVRVMDNGSPSMSTTQSFQVTVNGSGSSLAINVLAGGLKQLNISGDAGLMYELQVSTNLTSWDNLIQINLSTSPYPYIDPATATSPARFYRLKLIQ